MVICTTQDASENYASWDWGDEVLTDADGYAEWDGMPGVDGGYRVRPTDYSARAFFWQAIPGYADTIDERELYVDETVASHVHAHVVDGNGTAVIGADVQAVFDDGAVALDENQDLEVNASSDGSGNADLDLYPTHQELRLKVDYNGQTYYSDPFHPDTSNGDVDVSVTAQ
jgi:hypothetical protein